MTLTIKIEMDNAAFEDNAGEEAMRILREIEIPDVPGWSEKLRDINGNTVGTVKLS